MPFHTLRTAGPRNRSEPASGIPSGFSSSRGRIASPDSIVPARHTTDSVQAASPPSRLQLQRNLHPSIPDTEPSNTPLVVPRDHGQQLGRCELDAMHLRGACDNRTIATDTEDTMRPIQIASSTHQATGTLSGGVAVAAMPFWPATQEGAGPQRTAPIDMLLQSRPVFFDKTNKWERGATLPAQPKMPPHPSHPNEAVLHHDGCRQDASGPSETG
ncbi:hypothetical protein Purlil1_8482 [Purpureocillium lilacinum]|uniref:Uncharacterized protein n=1 Tax=Purpureocillium lilacinum TaxID=33203 RepID=A0ABR0BT63_PURLI|nr:hypothetical protein Purlil1_8482 [Purpureocillium lilacinum]